MNLKNLKNVRFKRELSEKTRIDAQIGFLIGILGGAVAGGIMILFFTPWEWYFKLFSAIGSLGIIGSLVLSLTSMFRMRKSYVETQKEMEKINEDSQMILKGGGDVKE